MNSLLSAPSCRNEYVAYTAGRAAHRDEATYRLADAELAAVERARDADNADGTTLTDAETAVRELLATLPAGAYGMADRTLSVVVDAEGHAIPSVTCGVVALLDGVRVAHGAGATFADAMDEARADYAGRVAAAA